MRKLFTLMLSFLITSYSINAQTVPMPDHVVIVIMENFGYPDIIGNGNAPHINALVADTSTALFTQSFALTHPSQPNYLMLYSGSNQGITNDNIPTSTPFSTCNLGASLIALGKTFAGYSETMPSTGYLGTTSGNYARKHNPWSNWQGTGVNQIPSNVNQTYTTFPTGPSYSSLPSVSFVVPNLVDDMHNPTNNSVTAISNGDTWFNNNISAYIQWAKNNNSLLILTWDEDDNNGGGNQILTMFVGQNVIGGQYSEHVDHYRILRTLEDMYGISTYCGLSSSSTPITDCWKTATGLQQFNSVKAQVNIWPVPATEVLNIEIKSQNQRKALMSLMDLSGKKLMEKEINLKNGSNNFDFNIQDISAGFYFIKLEGGLNIEKKIAIEK